MVRLSVCFEYRRLELDDSRVFPEQLEEWSFPSLLVTIGNHTQAAGQSEG